MECAFLGFCACVGLWFIERGILHLECAFLGFCACVGLLFIERGINITLGVLRLSWFLPLCWFMVYRTRKNLAFP